MGVERDVTHTLDAGALRAVGTPARVRRFRLQVLEGPAAGATWESSGERCAVGSHPSNDLVVDDPTVSRFHCELVLDGRGARVRDLGSLNGCVLDGVPVVEGWLRQDSTVRIGHTALRFSLGSELIKVATSTRSSFGMLVGRSAAMRAIYGPLERAAATDATVIIEGETGTGKSQVAESIHRESKRKDGPFLVIDCSAMPANLLENELFGHEKGSFTGADARRQGAFEACAGGTIFLDEIGEFATDLQPKILRVLENREIRRVGGTSTHKVDVRVIAATNRDLRAEVNAGRFRPDLYFRLAVVKILMPPLRARPEDLPDLVSALLERLGADAEALARLRSPEFLATLAHGAWPGNVRELRNFLERCVVYQEALPLGDEGEASAGVVADPGAADAAAAVTAERALAGARQQAVDAFERAYLVALMEKHEGKMIKAAKAAGIGRVYLYKLLQRHGLGQPAHSKKPRRS